MRASRAKLASCLQRNWVCFDPNEVRLVSCWGRRRPHPSHQSPSGRSASGKMFSLSSMSEISYGRSCDQRDAHREQPGGTTRGVGSRLPPPARPYPLVVRSQKLRQANHQPSSTKADPRAASPFSGTTTRVGGRWHPPASLRMCLVEMAALRESLSPSQPRERTGNVGKR
jgi:hypothetical protein